MMQASALRRYPILLLAAALLAMTVFFAPGAVVLPAVAAQSDTAAPSVASIAITSDPDDVYPFSGPCCWFPSTGTPVDHRLYGIGEVIQVTVTFDESVVVTGTPLLALRVGVTGQRGATFVRADQKQAVFEYTVADGDPNEEKIGVSRNPIRLSGGTIQDAAGNDAVLTHDGLDTDDNHLIDGERPQVTKFEPFASFHYYGSGDVYVIGEHFYVKVFFSEWVTTHRDNLPKLRIQLGSSEGLAKWDYRPWGRSFEYQIQEGDLDSDGISIGANAIDLNGGTIIDRAGNEANLSHGATVNNDALFVVDGVRPVIEGIQIISRPKGSAYRTGETVRVRVRFSENVKVLEWSGQREDGTKYRVVPVMKLTIGNETRKAEFEAGSVDGKNIVFAYTIQSSDEDTDGISIPRNSISRPYFPHGATLRDAVGTSVMGGNEANLDHEPLNHDSNHRVTVGGL